MNEPSALLRGRVALVTGGNSGIGFGMAEGLAAAGADIVIWGTQPDKNAAAADRLASFGTRVRAEIVDVSDEDQVARGVRRLVDGFGRLDACFANAGTAGAHRNPPFLESTLADWRAVISINLDGVYLTLREAARQMVRQGNGGSLVGTASLAGEVFGAPREEAYAAAKAGVVALTRSLAVELGKDGIRANALLPGWTVSPQMAPWAEKASVVEKILPRIPLGRWGRPEEWAGIAVYLAGDASSFHTGDTFRIDGGYAVY